MRTLHRQLRQPLFLITAISVIGLLITRQIGLTGVNRRDIYQYNTFSFLFHEHEPVFFALFIFLSVGSYFFLSRNWEHNLTWRGWTLHLSTRKRAILGVAIFAWAITGVGSYWVFHGYSVCVDEFMSDYQSAIFASGNLYARIDPAWRDLATPLTPTFAMFNAERNTWISPYLPIYATIRAVFSLLGIRSLTNSALAGLTILALAGVTRKLWPKEPSFPLIACLLLASSAQFLLMSMTAFSMPAHLYLNLVWLWLYTRSDRFSFLVMPWIGVLAMGLHNPVVHGLFAFPFLVRVVLTKQWAKTFYFAFVYALGCCVWLAWLVYVSNGVASGGGEPSLSSMFVLPGLTQVLFQTMNLCLMISWQSYALVFLVLIAFATKKERTAFEQDLIWSCLVTFLFYSFFRTSQVNGWGYRYAYSILGNLVLLSLMGWQELRRHISESRARILLESSLAIALLIQLPVRSIQAERFVRPQYASFRYIMSLPAPFVLLDSKTIWPAADLMRNDPFLQTAPKLLFSSRTQSQHLKIVKALGDVREVGGETLQQFGLPPVHPKE